MARRFQRKVAGRCKGARELQERWCFSGGSSRGVLGVVRGEIFGGEQEERNRGFEKLGE